MTKPIDRTEFLRRLKKLRVARIQGKRAPHKPLLILSEIAHTLRQPNQTRQYDQVDEDLSELLKRFGTPKKGLPNTRDPFVRLPADQLFELVDGDGRVIENPLDYTTKGQLKQEAIQGRFPQEVLDLLLSDSTLVADTIRFLLENNWPESYHRDILTSIGLDDVPLYNVDKVEFPLKHALKRDPKFREEVLLAYERTCAVCGYDLRLGDVAFGLEAAHIMWHSVGGPDVVTNGLALCSFHHKAFDLGAFTIDPEVSQPVVVVSQQLSGTSKARSQLIDFHKQPIRAPQADLSSPCDKYMGWHEREVFKGPPRP